MLRSLGMKTDRHGVDPGYRDAFERWRDADPELVAAIHAELGEPGSREPQPVIARAGVPLTLASRSELRLEDGTALGAVAALPPDLPAGYHEIHLPGEPRPRLLLVRPERCHFPAGLRTWGLAVQLYALRSRTSDGIGDLGDLAQLGAILRTAGAGVVLLNPLGAPCPTRVQEASPYYASTRLYRNPLYLELGPGEPATVGIDHDAVWRRKRACLETRWLSFEGDADFEAYCRAEGETLRLYGVFSALAERYDSGFLGWPAELRRPGSEAVSAFASAASDRVRFHQWIQWQLDRAVGRAARTIDLLTDLPVGFAGDGFDAWLWQDLLARGMSLGAPPDGFAPEGQDWGLPPFVPDRLRAARYAPWRQTLRAVFQHAAGIRIDHVMGLFRQYWLRQGTAATAGTYVRYPADELLAVLAIESQRARAYVIGEDLGTVEAGVRERLAAECILGYRLLWFETDGPESWPSLSAAAVTTHDLPTIAGLWSGADLEELRSLGLGSVAEAVRRMTEDANSRLGFREARSVGEAVAALHRRLGRAGSAIRLATLEDLLELSRRPNLPGTSRERANWRHALPLSIEEIAGLPQLRDLGAALGGS